MGLDFILVGIKSKEWVSGGRAVLMNFWNLRRYTRNNNLFSKKQLKELKEISNNLYDHKPIKYKLVKKLIDANIKATMENHEKFWLMESKKFIDDHKNDLFVYCDDSDHLDGMLRDYCDQQAFDFKEFRKYMKKHYEKTHELLALIEEEHKKFKL